MSIKLIYSKTLLTAFIKVPKAPVILFKTLLKKLTTESIGCKSPTNLVVISCTMSYAMVIALNIVNNPGVIPTSAENKAENAIYMP